MMLNGVGFANSHFCQWITAPISPTFVPTSMRDEMTGATGMKKPSARIRDEITRLQEQLKQAETREAERIGRLALKAGLGDIELDEALLIAAFEELAMRFRRHVQPGLSTEVQPSRSESGRQDETVTPGAAGRNATEA